jgi:hypothetical protein
MKDDLAYEDNLKEHHTSLVNSITRARLSVHWLPRSTIHRGEKLLFLQFQVSNEFYALMQRTIDKLKNIRSQMLYIGYV